MKREKKRVSKKTIAADFENAPQEISDIDGLRESEAKYRGFIENLPVMFYAAEPHPPYSPIYVSATFERFGYPLAEWRESLDLWVSAIHDDDRERVLQKIEAAVQSGEETDVEYRMVAKNGEALWVRDRGSFVRDESGNLVCWQGIIFDIDKRKLGEEKLRRSEKLYRTLALNIPHTSVMLFDSDLRFTLAEGINFDKHEYVKEPFVGKTVWEILPAELAEQWAGYYRRALEGEAISVEEQTTKGYFQIYVVPVKNESGEIFAGMVMWQDVSAQKTAENALRESERLYRGLTERSQGMICTHDLEGTLLSINSAAAAKMGYAPEEMIGKSVDFFMPPDNIPQFQLYLEHIKSEGEFVGSFCVLTRGGEERVLRFSNTLFEQNGTAPAFILGNAQDITALKRTEQELRALFEAMSDVIVVLDKNGRYLKIAPTDPTLLYRPADELLGKTLADVFPAERAAEFLGNIRAALKTKETQRFEYMLTIDRREVWFVAVVSPMTADTVVWVARDITERKRAEEALIESESRYRNLFENANDLIYIRDVEGNYLSINKATERVLGYTREEALTMNAGQIAAPEHLDRVRRMYSEELAGERQNNYEIDCIAKNGNRVTLEVNSNPIFKDGALIAVQGIARDVTERRRTEKALEEREEQYRELFENANDLIYTHDLKGNFTSLNRTGEAITGYTREEALKINIEQVIAPEYLELARRMTFRKIADKAPTTYQLEIIAKAGHRVLLELSTRLILQDGAPVGVQGIGRDITERKRAEESLVNSERRYRSLGEGIMHQVWTAQTDGKFDYVNGRAVEYLGLSFEQVIGDGWQTAVHPDDLAECLRHWRYSLETGSVYEAEFRLRRHDGEYRWHKSLATAAFDSDGKVGNWFGTNSDINDRKLAEAKLSHNALHDALTNLPNRVKFMNHLTRAISRAERNSQFQFAVLFLDLDRFKVINDSLGHSIGDKLLISIAERLELCIRPGDIVARLGGDEFTVLLNDINESADAVQVANRFLEEFSAPFKLDGYEVFSSASIGIIISDTVRRQPEDFLRDADTAMYRAKAAGKSRYEIFDREMHISNMKLLQIENDLRRAIEQDEFWVYYQPIVELDTGQIREFEALIRWQHPQRGLVQPSEFIGIAEETGLIIPIGRWILEESCRQIADWRKRFPLLELSVSVNLSAKQLLHPNLAQQIEEILIETKLDPRALKLEVTETMVMENSEKAIAVISELHRLGISVSTDDFGTGYSSLSYLHRFPFNRLKIDRSFVSKMDTDQKSEAIVRTILLLAQNLNIETVAEGIETVSQLGNLRQLGCRTGQGYLFSEPVNARSASRFLREGLPFFASTDGTSFSFNEAKNEKYVQVEKLR